MQRFSRVVFLAIIAVIGPAAPCLAAFTDTVSVTASRASLIVSQPGYSQSNQSTNPLGSVFPPSNSVNASASFPEGSSQAIATIDLSRGSYVQRGDDILVPSLHVITTANIGQLPPGPAFLGELYATGQAEFDDVVHIRDLSSIAEGVAEDRGVLIGRVDGSIQTTGFASIVSNRAFFVFQALMGAGKPGSSYFSISQTISGNDSQDFIRGFSAQAAQFANYPQASDGTYSIPIALVLQGTSDAEAIDGPSSSLVSFQNTASIEGIEILDANGNPLPPEDFVVTSDSGYPMRSSPTRPVPPCWRLGC